MLGLEEIAKLISAPEGIQETHLVDLENFAQNYPYTSLFSQLYLLGSKIHGKVNFDEELNKHAFRISDRSNLYFLIQDGRLIREEDMPEAELKTEILEETSHRTEAIEPADLTMREVLEEDRPAQNVQEDQTKIELNNLAENSSESEVPSEFGIAELEGLEFVQIEDAESETAETLINKVESTEASEKATLAKDGHAVFPEVEEVEKDLLEENLQLHLISSGYYLDELSSEEEQALEENQARKEDTDPALEEVVQSRDKEKDNASPNSFISWLHADKNHAPSPIESPFKAQSHVDDFASFNPVDQLSGIQERPKKEFFSPSKKAKESLNESTVPVSETLAKIFVLQGNYSKAIQVYEQLMLNYPEKKVFFANSIEQIKEKINNIS